MLNTLVFYNGCNKGDIHVSRELVKFLVSVTPAKNYVYVHKWSPRVILDLPVANGSYLDPQTKVPVFDRDKTFYHDPHTNLLALNTWYGVSPGFKNTWCSLNTLVDLFQHHIDRHEIKAKLPPIEKLIPRIDYSKYHIAGAREFLQRSWRKRVMVCDGPVLSGQTGGELDAFRAAVDSAAVDHPDILFLATEHGGLVRRQNVAYTSEVIGLPGGDTDLCECSYISTKCDVVIGRGSGPYTFAYVADNFLDSKKTMLCFTDGESTARWVYPESTVKARILWSNDYSVAGMRAKIEEAVR